MNHKRLRGFILACTGIAMISGAGCANFSTQPTPKPKPAMNQYVVGYQAYKRGELDLARRNLEAALINNPNLRMARSILGDIYRKQGDYARAAEQYEVLSRNDPYTLSNHYNLGVSYQFLRRFKESAVAYLKGLKLDANDFNSNMNLGTVYLALGETDEAVRYLDKATQIDPTSGTAWSNLGVALDARNSLVLAETAYRKGLERNPDSLSIKQNLANNLSAQQRIGEAKLLWEQIVTTSPTPFNQTKLAEVYITAMDFDASDKLLTRVMLSDPRFVPAINTQASSMIRQYELSGYTDDKLRLRAVELLKRSLALNGSQNRVAEELKKWSRQSGIGE